MANIARSNLPASDDPYVRFRQAQLVANQVNALSQQGTPPAVTAQQILSETSTMLVDSTPGKRYRV